jgi:hypothetical protein
VAIFVMFALNITVVALIANNPRLGGLVEEETTIVVHGQIVHTVTAPTLPAILSLVHASAHSFFTIIFFLMYLTWRCCCGGRP